MTDQPDVATVNFTLTSSDMFRAIAGETIRKAWYLLLLPIVGVISIVWAILDPKNGDVSVGNGCGALFVGALIFGGLPYFQTRAAMKNPNFRGLMTVTASENGIDFAGEYSNAKIGWPMIKGVSETSISVLIHLMPAGFLIVPKPQLSQADVAALKNVLRRFAPGGVKLA